MTATTRRLHVAGRSLFSSQKIQLEERIGIVDRSLTARMTLDHEEATSSRLASSQSCLELAAEAASQGNIDTGWAYLHRARELEVFGFSDEELTAAAVQLGFEANGSKLRDWRRAAVIDMVQRAAASSEVGAMVTSQAERRQWISTAMQIRNESLGGEYRALALLRQQQAVLLVLALLAFVPGVSLLVINSTRFDIPAGLAQSWLIVCSTLLGASGAVTSALQRSTRIRWQRVPEQMWSFVSSLSRPLVGLVAGLTVYLAARSGIVTFPGHEVAFVLLASFGAGFTERLVVRPVIEDSPVDSRATSG